MTDRNERLRKIAQEAIEIYNQGTMGAGGELPYPAWANDLLELIEEVEQQANKIIEAATILSRKETVTM